MDKETLRDKMRKVNWELTKELHLDDGRQYGGAIWLYHHANVEQTINNVIERVENVLPLKCIRDESNPDNCGCIACVRDTMRNEVKRIIDDEFGFAVHADSDGGKN